MMSSSVWSPTCAWWGLAYLQLPSAYPTWQWWNSSYFLFCPYLFIYLNQPKSRGKCQLRSVCRLQSKENNVCTITSCKYIFLFYLFCPFLLYYFLFSFHSYPFISSPSSALLSPLSSSFFLLPFRLLLAFTRSKSPSLMPWDFFQQDTLIPVS